MRDETRDAGHPFDKFRFALPFIRPTHQAWIFDATTKDTLQIDVNATTMLNDKAKRSWVQRFGLAINCFLNTPMWAMAITSFAYGCFGLGSRNRWMRTLSLLYLPVCLLERADGSRYTWLYSYEFTELIRSLATFRWVADYFPVRLVKTTELPSNRTYLFAYHPHGVISMGCNTALNTNACGFDRIFPGIQRLGVTLNVAFCAPLYREWMMAAGFVNADRKTLEKSLLQGYSIVLVPGGAREALLAEPESCRLLRRRGFLKMAKETNACIVPCYGFGENDAFQTVVFRDGSLGRRIQNWLLKVVSASTPILSSPFCNQCAIDVVVGAPIDPSTFSMEELQEVYWTELQKLYKEHRNQFRHETIEMHFDS